MVNLNSEGFNGADVGRGSEKAGRSTLVGDEGRSCISSGGIYDWRTRVGGAGLCEPSSIHKRRKQRISGQIIGIERAKPCGSSGVSDEVYSAGRRDRAVNIG